MSQVQEPQTVVDGRAGRIGVVVLFLVVAGLVILTHRCRNRSLISAHGLLHTAIAQEATAGGVPPDNPFAAGTELPYYWSFQYVAGSLGGLLGVHPLYTFEALNLLGLALFVAGLAILGRRIFKAWLPGLLAAALGLVAANPFGPLFLIERILEGRVDLTARADAIAHIHPFYKALYMDDFRDGPNLVYFFNVTSRGLAMGLVAVTVALVDRFLARPSGGLWVLTVAVSVALGTMSPLLGAGVTAALCVGLAWLWTGFGSHASFRTRATRTTLAAAAVAIGQLGAFPSWSGAASGVTSSLAWIVSPGDLALAMIRIAVAGGPLFLVAVLGLRRGWLQGAWRSSWFFVSGTALLAATVVVRLPAGNEHNLFQLATVFLAVPAARALVRLDGPDRLARGRVLLAALLFVPSPLLQVAAYWHRDPALVEFPADRVVFLDRPSHQSAYDWLCANTPARAVILDTAWPDEPRPPVLQNVSVVPAATGRRLFWDRPSYVVPDTLLNRERIGVTFQIYCGEELTGPQLAYMIRFPDPIYVLTTSPGGRDRAIRALRGRARVVHQNDRLAVLQLDRQE